MLRQVELGAVTCASLVLVVLLRGYHAARQALDAIYHIPADDVSFARVTAIIPVNRERPDAVVFVYDEHPSTLLFYQSGPAVRPRYIPPLPSVVSIVGGAVLPGLDALYLVTRRLSVIALSLETLGVLWRTDDISEVDVKLQTTTLSLVDSEESDGLVLAASVSNGSILHAYFNLTDVATPPIAVLQLCLPAAGGLDDGLHNFFASHLSKEGPLSCVPSVPLALVSGATEMVKFPAHQPDGSLNDVAPFCSIYLTPDNTVVSLSSGPLMQRRCVRFPRPRSYASILVVQSAAENNVQDAVESLFLHLPCRDCLAVVNKSYISLHEVANFSKRSDVLAFASGLRPPLLLSLVPASGHDVTSAASAGLIVVGGPCKMRSTGLVVASGTTEIDARPTWQTQLPEPPLLLHYSATWRHLVVLTKRHLALIEPRRGRLVAIVPLDELGGVGRATRQRRRLGRSRAGSPSGLLVEEGFIWIAMEGAECAALVIDLCKILRAPWMMDVFSVLSVLVFSTGIPVVLRLHTRKSQDARERRTRQTSAAVRVNAAGVPIAGSLSACTAESGEAHVGKRRKSFRKKDL